MAAESRVICPTCRTSLVIHQPIEVCPACKDHIGHIVHRPSRVGVTTAYAKGPNHHPLENAIQDVY